MKGLLSQCSTILRTLDIRLNAYRAETKEIDEDPLDSDRQMEWSSLREVSLELFRDTPNVEEFLDWLWSQCGQVEVLKVRTPTQVQSLARRMWSHMPHLREISLQRISDEDSHYQGDMVATLLSGSRAGWRRVEVTSGAVFQSAAMKVLVNHFATLEELILDECYIGDIDLVQVLRSCSRLQRIIISNASLLGGDEFHYIGASAFVDRDPDTGELRK
ncbi:hypothetical protein B0O80DRAFT_454097 [Mortierella sp. GBAus27b]|nr:hypothetical protein B0O80DRAFT_454097 [Mortierella sp. GBAus27b]